MEENIFKNSFSTASAVITTLRFKNQRKKTFPKIVISNPNRDYFWG